MELKSELDVMQEQIVQKTKTRTIGRVLTVTEHTSVNDKSNHEANVMLRGNDKELRRVPIAVTRSGEAMVPQVDDTVIVSFLSGDGTAPIITDILHNSDQRAPLGRKGHWRQRFGANDDLFLEAEPSDHSGGDADVIRIAKKPDGLSDPSISVELDNSGSTTTARLVAQPGTSSEGSIEIDENGNITLDASGDITLSAPNGNVRIDEGGGTTKVARQDHNHDVNLSDGSNATTGKPNQNGTETEIH